MLDDFAIPFPSVAGKCPECGKASEYSAYCDPCHRKVRHQDRVRAATRAVEPLMRAMPDWNWAVTSDPLFAERVRVPGFRAFAERWEPRRGSVLLSAPSGAGKTSAMRAVAARLALAAIETADPTAPIVEAVWAKAHALVRAVKEHRLGGGLCHR